MLGGSIAGVACQAIAWRGRPLGQFLREAREAGYEGSELTSWQAARWSVAGESLREKLESAGLPLVALYHSARLCRSEGQAEEFAGAVQAAEMARELGAKILVLGSPPADRNAVVPDRGALDRIGEACVGMGLSLAYQPHYGGPVQTPDEVDRLMEGTKPEFVSMCLDTAHIAWGGGDPSATMRKWGHRVRYIQLKDLRSSAPGWGERLGWLVRYARLGSFNGYLHGVYPLQQGLRAVRSVMFAVPGTGRIDFGAFWGVVESVGYRGWLTVELDAPVLDPGQAMADGLDFVRSLINPRR